MPKQLDAAIVEHAAHTPEDFGFGDARFAGDVAAANAADDVRPTKILSGGGTWQHDPTMVPLQEAAPSLQPVGAPS